MLTGTVLRTRTLMTKSGRPVVIRIVRPDQTVSNTAALANASHQWRREGLALPPGDPQVRALFASDVAFLAAGQLGRCPPYCILVAEQADGTIRGATLYRMEDNGTWQWDLMTTDPANQGGGANPDPIRGIGSELVGAAAADMAQRNCSKVELEALDSAAERYWRARGFHNTKEPLHMTCPELRTLATVLACSPPDRPDEGDVVGADSLSLRRRVNLRLRASPTQ